MGSCSKFERVSRLQGSKRSKKDADTGLNTVSTARREKIIDMRTRAKATEAHIKKEGLK